ncbi:ATP-dependent 6-phosphofructokinase [Alicyclobacillus contaminans]|uniref:6-phosphofructokinase n=1 Tax=Alicyclobacillus contaminans TaxID=392016 RepID=UPI0004097E0D|nr:6-phosphofructokinase [Alicyclobacillus contaminans]GMA51171.1 ATP-dependent 6-phosphofructokinase [Alicyclobacillus contaminans]
MRRIGVLTSGGDAPGMNAAIRAVVRSAIYNRVEVLGIRHGFQGLLEGDMVPLGLGSVADIIQRGGTMLFTSRCEAFKTDEGQAQGVERLRAAGIEGLVVIGGDGSFRGARALSQRGIATVGIPGTIDNDIPCCDTTIGFDTAVNTAIEAVDKIRDTVASHDRVSVVEVMGRNAGDIALHVALAGGAESVLVPEYPVDLDDVVARLYRGLERGKRHSIVVVAEGTLSGPEVAAYLTRHTGFDVRATVLGHIQRGGAPTARDRVLASQLGNLAVQRLLDGATGQMVCVRDGSLCAVDFEEVFQGRHTVEPSLYRLVNTLAI